MTKTTSLSNSTSILGEYLQITLPYSIVLTSYQLQGVTGRQIPTSWYICGSLDGITFTVLDYIVSGQLSLIDTTKFYNVFPF